ncbi:MAG: polysaccharide biosynthesis/export family protein [Rhizomicrobium sp.]|jgi:polysaccharide export outer membrane protein
MSRKCAIYGVAAALALAAAPAFAEDAGARLQPPSEQPRYATMISPDQDSVLDNAPPVAAPTVPVTTAPASAPSTDNAAQPQPQSQPAPRYATMYAPPQNETVTVIGLRPSQDTSYRLDTGDTVRVTVFGETDLSGTFEIDSTGYVRLPLIGQVPAAGLSTFGLEARVASALTQGGFLLNPRVNVEVTTYRPFYIIGEVSKPGEYPYVNAMSVPNAIALAGGYTDRAAESEVYIRHQGETKGQDVPADESTRIRPGDVVRVERSTYWSIMTLLAPIISPFATVAYLLK